MNDSLVNTIQRASKRGSPTLQLQERDRELFAWVFVRELAERSQMEERFFSSTCRCNARLLQLVRAGYLKRLDPNFERSHQAVYKATARVYESVAQTLGVDTAAIRRIDRARTTHRHEHSLGLVDLELSLRRSLRDLSDVHLDLWLAEWQCRHSFEVLERGKRGIGVFKPDAFCRLALANRAFASFFVEYDRGHCSLPKWQLSAKRHEHYRVGHFEAIYGTKEGFKTLVVTSAGPKRLERLKRASEQVSRHTFLFAQESELQRDGFLTCRMLKSHSSEPVTFADEISVEKGA